jgi:single-strand DNA-binding protein
MAATNINRVILTGNLTRDPELRSTNSGFNICSLRLAVNNRRKDNQSGQWVDEPNYFDITVFGAQGENCAKFLSRGRPVAIDGRLKWREWTDQNTQQKRQAVEVIADSVQFLGGGQDGGGQGGGGYGSYAPQQSDVPADVSDFQRAPAPVGGGMDTNGHSAPADDDIPF